MSGGPVKSANRVRTLARLRLARCLLNDRAPAMEVRDQEKESRNMESTRKKVLCPLDRNGKTFWMRIGSAFINKDGSTNVYLDAFPTERKLQIRDLDERDRQGRKNDRDQEDGPMFADRDPVPF